MEKIKVCFTGGGTGGHIYPGLAVCDELRKICEKNQNKIEIYWLGNSCGMDKNLVENSFYSENQRSADYFVKIPSGKLRRYFSFKNFLDIFKIFSGFIVSFFALLKIKPSLLFSKGGFVSVPPCFSAKILKIPVFTHECDFTPGLATKLNSKCAENIFVSCKQTSDYFPDNLKSKIVVTGNPVRPSFYSASAKNGLEFLNIPENHEKPVLLVLGGSSGSLQINTLIEENISWLTERFIVVHQTGKNQVKIQNSDDYKAYQFIYAQMKDVIASSDIVLSRSGANSIWECSVCAKPMLLIPLSGSGTRGDQIENARFFETEGAAKVLYDGSVNSENLKSALSQMILKDNLQKYSENSKRLSSGEKPAEKIASLLYQKLFSHKEKKN